MRVMVIAVKGVIVVKEDLQTWEIVGERVSSVIWLTLFCLWLGISPVVIVIGGLLIVFWKKQSD